MDSPAVMIKGEVVLGVEAALGQRSVPLGGRRLRGIGEVQRRSDASRCQRSSLGVAERPRRSECPGAWRIQTPSTARALTGNATPELGDARVLDLGDQPGDTLVLPARDQLDRLLVR
jgi:hypothetical protein